ncbi:hypothetical protein CesoFtcFv8_012003 [Champsocephalus esox]|uniref:Serine/threonine-protein kinase PINK1, mitochondrial n=1 Tax=Champsocephalus esox TaxID=159716 RepID=A0AAN8C3V0_9TELE|nr:hypothetical protein CesoFtcFv8_012003 [Champsocephalus esox]
MSVRHALSRGLELGRSLLLVNLKPGARVAARLRVGGASVSAPQPRVFLPSRYRYYRSSLRGLAARMLASVGFRSSGGSPRNRAVFLAFGLGVGLVEQLEEDRRSTATCEEIQAVFRRKRFPSSMKTMPSGYKLHDYIIGAQIGKGSNAAVYEAAARFTPKREEEEEEEEVKPREEEEEVKPRGKGVKPREEEEEVKPREEEEEEVKEGAPSLTCSFRRFPLAIKMMWNFGAGSSSEAILSSMSQELVPAGRLALYKKGEEPLDGHFGFLPRRVSAHPNVIRVHRAFTAEVPLLPGAREEYPDVLPARLNPGGLGNNRTLFLVMKSYPGTLRQFLSGNQPSRRQRVLMLLQLLEGVQHLCSEGVAHRDLKTDNILLELDSAGCPRLVISDFGCCLSQSDCSLQLPFNSMWVSRGGNACLMAPEVSSASPGRASVIDYRKADGWAVGAVAYEIFGEQNPFYGAGGLQSRSYEETQLPPPPPAAPADVQLVIQLLLRRSPSKRPSARVAANMLHLSLWGGGRALSDLRKLSDWLLCQSAVVLLGGCSGPGGCTVEAELQRSFLSNLDLEELRTAGGFLLYGRGGGSGI